MGDDLSDVQQLWRDALRGFDTEATDANANDVASFFADTFGMRRPSQPEGLLESEVKSSADLPADATTKIYVRRTLTFVHELARVRQSRTGAMGKSLSGVGVHSPGQSSAGGGMLLNIQPNPLADASASLPMVFAPASSPMSSLGPGASGVSPTAASGAPTGPAATASTAPAGLASSLVPAPPVLQQDAAGGQTAPPAELMRRRENAVFCPRDSCTDLQIPAARGAVRSC